VKAIGLACALLGCVPRADTQQCEALADHVVELSRAAHAGRAAEIAAAVAGERREEVLDRCLAAGTVAEVECVLATTTLEAIVDCAP
jgi:hypothetical protein